MPRPLATEDPGPELRKSRAGADVISMEGKVLDRPRHLIPQRECNACGKRLDVLHLTKIGIAWLCATCHRSCTREEKPTGEAPISGLSEDRKPVMSSAQAIRLADTAYRASGMAIKLAFYGFLYGLSTEYPFLLIALSGCFLADVVTWVIGSWFDWQFHRKAVLIELILYSGATIALQNLGAFDLPEDPGDRAIMGIAFSAALALKLLQKGWKLFLDPSPQD